jgi:hypothetical protein
MSSPQEQYAESLRTGQEAVAQAIDSWTKSAQTAFGTESAGTPESFDPNQVIDQVFDFAEQMLHVQREYAKTLTATAGSVAEAVRKQTDPVTGAARKQADAATGAARRQADTPRRQSRARKG